MKQPVKLTTALLQRAARLAEQQGKIQSQLARAFIDRYGRTYLDVNCDPLIDTLDYNGGYITLKECDRLMREAGSPPIKDGSPDDE